MIYASVRTHINRIHCYYCIILQKVYYLSAKELVVKNNENLGNKVKTVHSTLLPNTIRLSH